MKAYCYHNTSEYETHQRDRDREQFGRFLGWSKVAVSDCADDPLAAAFELAGEITRRSPDAMRAAKQLLDKAPQLSVEQGLRLEEGLQRRLMDKANQVEAVKANLAKRAPEFSDPT